MAATVVLVLLREGSKRADIDRLRKAPGRVGGGAG